MNSEKDSKLKPVIVTGANGFTGRFVCEELLKRKVPFLALVRPKTDINWFVERSIKVIFADINNFKDMSYALSKGSSLINIASIGFGAAPILIKACKKENIKRVIFISTTAIFTKLNSKSKSIRINAEDFILKSNLEFTILRPTMIYGNYRDRNLIKLIKWIKRYPFIPVFNKGLALQQPIYVEDVAWAVVTSLLDPNAINQIFNISGAYSINFSEMIDVISKSLNKRIIKIPVNPKFAIILIKVLKYLNFKVPISEEQINRVIEDKIFSNAKAKKIINFHPLSFQDGIKKEINQYLISLKTKSFK